jgi:hypothetical protein
VEWLKVKALSSNPNTGKNKIKISEIIFPPQGKEDGKEEVSGEEAQSGGQGTYTGHSVRDFVWPLPHNSYFLIYLIK